MIAIRKSSIVLCICLFLCFIAFSSAQYSTCSWMEANTDFKGNDITYTYNANTAQACANLCSSVSICTGFTFWAMTATSNVCFLKNFTSTPTRYASVNRIN